MAPKGGPGMGKRNPTVLVCPRRSGNLKAAVMYLT